jgi:SPP1 gp7 family putative phage head morphogenesis protein
MITKEKLLSLKEDLLDFEKEIMFHQSSDDEKLQLHGTYNQIKIEEIPVYKNKLDELAVNISSNVEEIVNNWVLRKQSPLNQQNDDGNDNQNSYDSRDAFLLIALTALINTATNEYLVTKYVQDVKTAYDRSAQYYTDLEVSNISKKLGKDIPTPPKPQIDFNHPLVKAYYGQYAKKAFSEVSDKYGPSIESIIRNGYEKGLSVEEIASQIKKSVDPSNPNYKMDYVWQRIANTETAFYTEQAKLDSWNNLGIGKVQFMSMMDSHVCPVCAGLNGKIYTVTEVGKTIIIPVHSNCRCTWIPIYEADALAPFMFLPFINH